MIQLVLYANIGGGRHSVLPPVTAERQTYCSPVYISNGHLAGVHIMIKDQTRNFRGYGLSLSLAVNKKKEKKKKKKIIRFIICRLLDRLEHVMNLPSEMCDCT